MRSSLAVFLTGAGLLITACLPLAAHHSFAAEFDATKSVSLQGTVTKLDWMNPHARFYIDVKDDAGAVTNWELELGSPNALMRLGWTRNSLKPGEQVSMEGSLAKDGSKLANARKVTLADGRKVFAGSAVDSEDKK